MGFFEDLESDAADLLAEIGQSVQYTPNGGSPATVTGAFSELEASPQNSPDGRSQVRRGVVQLHADDAATPDTRDSFTIGSTVWAVESVAARRPLVVFNVVAMGQHRVGGSASHVQR